MTLVIQNADNKLFDLLSAINIFNNKSYKIIKEDDVYPNSLVSELLEEKEELKRQIADGSVKTYTSMEEFKYHNKTIL